MFITWSKDNLSISIPGFASIKFCKDILFLLAISENVSPDLTLYILPPFW